MSSIQLQTIQLEIRNFLNSQVHSKGIEYGEKENVGRMKKEKRTRKSFTIWKTRKEKNEASWQENVPVDFTPRLSQRKIFHGKLRGKKMENQVTKGKLEINCLKKARTISWEKIFCAFWVSLSLSFSPSLFLSTKLFSSLSSPNCPYLLPYLVKYT